MNDTPDPPGASAERTPDDLGLHQAVTAAAEWVWVPPDAVDVRRPEYRITHYPRWTSVSSSRLSRPFPTVLAEVREEAEQARTGRLRWWVTGSTQPVETAALLLESGFAPAEVVDVMALDLRGDLEALVRRLNVPADVSVTGIDDIDGLRVAGLITAEAFGWAEEPTSAQLQEASEAIQAGHTTGVWSQRQFLAAIDGEPVGQAGCTLTDEVVRLWAGAVSRAARGRGCYRALLAERYRFGVANGARLALVKGRIDTSAPTLRRAGFVVYGQERCFELLLV